MSGIPDPPTDPQDTLKDALEVIQAHRTVHGYAMVQRCTKIIKDTSEPWIVYLKCDCHSKHISISVGIQQASTKAIKCPYSIVLYLKDGDQ